MKANCLVCRGACCEDLVFPADPLTLDSREFLTVRCGEAVPLTRKRTGFVLPVRCPQLSTEGLCSIYEKRPVYCRLYEPGGEACLEVLKRRRTPEQVAQILQEE